MIKKAQSKDALVVAGIHFHALKSGFLPKLGIPFLTSLYHFLIEKEIVYVFHQDNEIIGFLSSTPQSSNIMKRFILHNPMIILRVLSIILVKPVLLKSIIESMVAPLKYKKSNNSALAAKIPTTELLTIAIDSATQKKGIGSKLLKQLESQFLSIGVQEYKVIAGANLTGANNFYRKNGFKLVSQVSIHGSEVSNLYVKNIG